MRYTQFFENLKQLDYGKIYELATKGDVNGGWEIWLQVEIASCLTKKFQGRIYHTKREIPYEDGSGRKCDFVIWYEYIGDSSGEQHDVSYIELKCINPCVVSPQTDALYRYHEDIIKADSISGMVACMLVYYGDIGYAKRYLSDKAKLDEIHVLNYNGPASEVQITNVGVLANAPDEGQSPANLYILYYDSYTE